MLSMTGMTNAFTEEVVKRKVPASGHEGYDQPNGMCLLLVYGAIIKTMGLCML